MSSEKERKRKRADKREDLEVQRTEIDCLRKRKERRCFLSQARRAITPSAIFKKNINDPSNVSRRILRSMELARSSVDTSSRVRFGFPLIHARITFSTADAIEINEVPFLELSYIHVTL